MRIILFIFSLIPLTSQFTAAQVQFQHIYGGPGQTELYYAQKTLDGGYVMVGYTSGVGAGGYDIYLVKTDNLGIKVWDKTYGGVDTDLGYFVVQTADSGFVISGSSGISAASKNIILKTDASGNLVWSKIIQTNNYLPQNKILQTPDGGYITNTPQLVKTDALGNMVWIKTYSGQSIVDMALTNDGGIMCLTIKSGYERPCLTKVNTSGNVLWSKMYDFDSEAYVRRIQKTSDGGFIITGIFDQDPSQSSENMHLLARFDSTGNSMWGRAYKVDTHDDSYDVIETSDLGYAITGNTYSGNDDDMILIKTDATGDPVWTKQFGIIGYDELSKSILQNSDQGFTIGGITYSQSFVCWLVRTDSTGTSGCDEINETVTDTILTIIDSTITAAITNTTSPIASLSLSVSSGGTTGILCNNMVSTSEYSPEKIEIFPNPATDYLTIDMGNVQSGNIQIFDIIGNMILSTAIENESSVNIDLKNFSAAMYVVRITTGNVIYNRKIIVE